MTDKPCNKELTVCLAQAHTNVFLFFVLLSSPPPPHSLSSNVFRSLRSIVLEPEQGPVRLRILAAAILRELSPLQKMLVRDFTPPTDPQNIPIVLPVLLAQVCKGTSFCHSLSPALSLFLFPCSLCHISFPPPLFPPLLGQCERATFPADTTCLQMADSSWSGGGIMCSCPLLPSHPL